MTDSELFALWCLLVGVLLIAMTMGRSLIARLPLSSAMLYLAVGYALGPAGLSLLALDPFRDAALLERLTEIAVLISLFVAGFKLELPPRDPRWRIPLQLATISMLLTVTAIAAVGVFLLGLSPGAAVLLGAILAPTDPVLASDVQLANPGDRDRLRFGLTGEGGLNDGMAFPFVMLGLGLMSLHDLGAGAWRWWTVDVVWAIGGGLAIGYALGSLVGAGVLFLRTRDREALVADEFIAFGLIAVAYGCALLAGTYGFLAVFAAGLASRRVGKRSTRAAEPGSAGDQRAVTESTGGPQAPAEMMDAVQRFNEQLERFAEVAIVLTVGALLASVHFAGEVLWLIPLLFLVIRPLSVWAGLIGTNVVGIQRALIAWFGIRGIGSIYYLMYAITHSVGRSDAERLTSITIAVVVASIVAHGVSVTPLMVRYERWKVAERKQRRGG